MLQNPSQGIRNYSANDVYTPGDSNSRRLRIPFDFVITDAQLQAYKSKHPTITTIDIANVILCNADGTDGAGLDTPLSHPISIYIDAQTGESDVFNFNNRLRSGGQIFSAAMISAWSQGYGGGTVVSVYSRAPFSVACAANGVVGGLAFYSTSESYVNILSSTGSPCTGIMRVGACKVSGTYNAYPRAGYTAASHSGITLIYEKCLGGAITWGPTGTTPPTDGTEPGAVCAPWMSADVDCQIPVASGLTHEYGIYAKVAQALRLGAKPKLKVASAGNKESYLPLASTGGVAGSDAYATFEGDGIKATVTEDDNIAWDSAGGSSEPIIVTDFRCFANSYITPQCSIYRSGTFLSDSSSINAALGGTGLRVGSINRVKWVTWGYGTYTGAASDILNQNTVLCIDANSVTAGKVYEVDLTITCAEYTASGSGAAAPDGSVTLSPRQADPDGFSYVPSFYLQFKDGTSVVVPKIWGTTTDIDSRTHGSSKLVRFSLAKDSYADEGIFEYAQASVESFPILASAKLWFVKIGGNIYITAY